MGRKSKGSGRFPEITRRDFVGGTLIGSGAALLLARAPGLLAQTAPGESYRLRLGHSIPLPLTGLDQSWTGPGGTGDYSVANGDTYREVNAAHAFIRNGELTKRLGTAKATGEHYDLVVVGSGFAGCSAAYTFLKKKA